MMSLKSPLACSKVVSVVMVMVAMMMMNEVNAAISCTNWCGTSAHLDTSVGETGSVPITAYYFYNQSYPPSVFLTSSNIQCPIQFFFFNNFQSLTINGTVASPSDSSSGFIIAFQLRAESTYNPNLDLQSNAYVQNGGTVDPTTFLFYTLTQGTLAGYGSYQGVSLSMSEFMHPLQIGTGANGKNLNFGAGGWFSYVNTNRSIIQTDLNVDLTCACDAATTCSSHGSCAADNSCACNTGYTGSSCNQCSSGYTGYPNCVVTCDAATTCSSHGSCAADGSCVCAIGYTGSSCNQCSSGYTGYPSCTSISGGIIDSTTSSTVSGANQVYVSMAYIVTAVAALVIFA